MKRKLPAPECISSECGGTLPRRPETRHTVRKPVAAELNAQHRRPKDNVTDKRPEHA